MQKALTPPLTLAEGGVWDEKTLQLYFVDIEGYRVYRYDSRTYRLDTIDTKDYVGFIVLDQEGQVIAGIRDKLVKINFQTGVLKTLLDLELPDYLRFNDGKCDPQGNLWVGTMAIKQDDVRAKGGGSLYCIKQNAVLRQYTGYTIPNGLAWDAEGTCFYHIDTPTHCIDAYDVVGEGCLANRRTVIKVGEEEGSPDGMCRDDAGNLWVAMWGGHQVICYNPKNGEKLEVIKVPDTNVSCPTFGGEKLQTLFITTAKDEKGMGGYLYTHPMRQSGTKAHRYGKSK